MNKILLAFFLLAAQEILAQDDSLYLDLGRMRVRKESVQHIRVSARELEKMPFATLSEILNTRFYGMFSNVSTLTYLVDGNLVTDINAYSIHDLEDITLVQSAVALLNGASGSEQLVLVRTKKNAPSGIRAAGQSFLVNRKIQTPFANEEKSETNFFHQYTLGFSRNSSSFRYGIQGNYLRDVLPLAKYELMEIRKPAHLDRMRLTGYLETTIGKQNELHVNLNYAPQFYDHESNYRMRNVSGSQTKDDHGKESVVNASLKFRSFFGKGFRNQFSVTYNRFNSLQEDRVESDLNGTDNRTDADLEKFLEIFTFRDQIEYRHQMGKWELVPAVSLTKQFIKREIEGQTVTTNGSNVSYSEFRSKAKGEPFFITPSLSASLGNVLHVQAGTVINTMAEKRQAQPFVLGSINLLKIAAPDLASSLLITASYSTASNYSERYFQYGSVFYLPAYYRSNSIVVVSPYSPSIIPMTALPEWYNLKPSFQTGAVFATGNERIRVHYNFESRNHQQTAMSVGPWGPTYSFVHTHTTIHHAGLQAKPVEKGNTEWTTGLNIANIQNKTDPSGTVLADWRTWSGGWINRLRIGQFLFGTELSYILRDKQATQPGEIVKKNFFSLQSIYAGYRLNTGRNKELEFYISSRNPVQSKESAFEYDRRFVGLGASVKL